MKVNGTAVKPNTKTNTNTSTGISIFKLHGSLNWFSMHKSHDIPGSMILNPNKDFRITPRREIPENMIYKGKAKSRSVHTFPLIVPPVHNKAAIIHKDIHLLWKKAEETLENASKIVIFGYSCPISDFESANLLRRAISRGSNLTAFEVIDPNPATVQRFIDVTGLQHLTFYRSADAYINNS